MVGQTFLSAVLPVWAKGLAQNRLADLGVIDSDKKGDLVGGEPRRVSRRPFGADQAVPENAAPSATTRTTSVDPSI